VTDHQPDPYACLGIPRSADPQIVAAAYRAQARLHHPDIAPGPRAQQRMAELNAAYAILRDPATRTAWDAAHGLAEPTLPSTNLPYATIDGRGRAAGAVCTWIRGAEGVGAAGPPPGRPSGSVLMFGRHLCWSIGEIARVDPGYLQWLAERPEGRPYRAEIEAVLEPLVQHQAGFPSGGAQTASRRRRRPIWRR